MTSLVDIHAPRHDLSESVALHVDAAPADVAAAVGGLELHRDPHAARTAMRAHWRHIRHNTDTIVHRTLRTIARGAVARAADAHNVQLARQSIFRYSTCMSTAGRRSVAP